MHGGAKIMLKKTFSLEDKLYDNKMNEMFNEFAFTVNWAKINVMMLRVKLDIHNEIEEL